MAANHQGKTPITMLSGFLGAGKTTLLRYLLENSTEKIACVVNDVASINIDAKLVRNDKNRASGKSEQLSSTKDLTDTVELQNGCACCNLQDELFASFEQILALADKRGEPYARIVLENSGVAEPSNIRDKFKEAEEQGHPLLERIYLDTLVTVVDASTFGKDFASRVPTAARPDLGDGGNMRPVVDLLVEQIECADYVLLNKTDLLQQHLSMQQSAPPSEGQLGVTPLEELVAIVSSLNPLANVIACQEGKVDLDTVFGSKARAVVAHLTVEGQHRGAVAAAKTLQDAGHDDEHHKHSHKHDHHHHDHDHKHDHDHHHDHDHKHEEHECGGEKCTHESHKHDHDHHHHHDHKHEEHECGGDKCTHESHKHDHDHHHHHDHKHEHSHDCEGDKCTHESHKHDHDHHHHHQERPATRAALRFGIRSFVYCRRRPFHPQRLKEMVLKWMPVTTNTAIDAEAPEMGDSPIKTVLRSKGFMWMSNSHSTAYYWSHAGQHFEIRDEGDWWAAVPDEDWPEEGSARDTILSDWEVEGAYGDRRQEIVFIGVNMDEPKICAQLDGALLTDEEMQKYAERWAAVADPPHPSVELMKQHKRAKHEHAH